MPMVFFYTPENQKISDFLMFLRGIGKDWWHEMSQLKGIKVKIFTPVNHVSYMHYELVNLRRIHKTG